MKRSFNVFRRVMGLLLLVAAGLVIISADSVLGAPPIEGMVSLSTQNSYAPSNPLADWSSLRDLPAECVSTNVWKVA